MGDVALPPIDPQTRQLTLVVGWRAALGHDLPLLVYLTLLLTILTVGANATSDIVIARLGMPSS